MMEVKKGCIGAFAVLLLFFSGVGEVMGQLACEPTNPLAPDYFTWQGRERGVNHWSAAVFQLSPDYRPEADRVDLRDFRFWDNSLGALSAAHRTFKGYMLRNNSGLYLPIAGLTFDTRFEDNTIEGQDEGFFFPTAAFTAANSTGGCLVEKQYFGLMARSRYTVPAGGEGIYIVTIGSDDGSNFRMFQPHSQHNLDANVLADINGRLMIHDNWFKDGSDGVYNFVYEDNIRNYYVYLTEGQEVWMNLNYYEKTIRSRLSFDFRLYVGPGEINIGNNFLKSDRYCGIDPNPVTFEEFGPAVFADGTIPSYEWEFSLVNNPDPSNWNVISGANGNTYDIPAFSELTTEEFKDFLPGTLYFRRIAIDSNGERFPTNVLEISLDTIAEMDQEQYGDNTWIGHIYNGIGDFTSGSYLGRQYETEVDFVQNFREGPFPGQSGQVDFIPDHGCPFYVDRFSVRYKMRYSARPGEYTVQVRGDDGFRLSIDGGATWIIQSWTSAAVRTITAQFEVDDEEDLFIILEYFDNIGDQTIQFSFANIILPVEWGRVSGEACGAQNCLTWETVQEKNTSHFSVERSYDGKEWAATGEPIPGQGYSTQATWYSFSDGSFLAERTFYRIRQVDLDGSVDYSEIVRIDNASFARKMAPYPNPTTDRLRFYSPDMVKMVRISSHDARVQRQLSFEPLGQNIYEVDISMLQNSQYIVTVVSEQSSHHHKVIKR